MRPWGEPPAGRFDEHVFASEVLRGNPLGDPHERPLWVYVPPGYDAEPGRRYPSVYLIQGLTGQLDMWRNRSAFRRDFPEMLDETIAAGEAPPCICVRDALDPHPPGRRTPRSSPAPGHAARGDEQVAPSGPTVGAVTSVPLLPT